MRSTATRGLSSAAWRQQQQQQELAAAIWEMPSRDSLTVHIRVRLDAIIRCLMASDPAADSTPAPSIHVHETQQQAVSSQDCSAPGSTGRKGRVGDAAVWEAPDQGRHQAEEAARERDWCSQGSSRVSDSGSAGSSSVISDDSGDKGGAAAAAAIACLRLQELLRDATVQWQPTSRQRQQQHTPSEQAAGSLPAHFGRTAAASSSMQLQPLPTAHFAASYLHALLILSWEPVRKLPGSCLDDLAAPSTWLLPTPAYAAAVEALGTEHLVLELLSLHVLGQPQPFYPEASALRPQHERRVASPRKRQEGTANMLQLLGQLLAARPSLAVGMLAALCPETSLQSWAAVSVTGSDAHSSPGSLGAASASAATGTASIIAGGAGDSGVASQPPADAALVALLVGALRRACADDSSIAGATAPPPLQTPTSSGSAGPSMAAAAAAALQQLRCLVAVCLAAQWCLTQLASKASPNPAAQQGSTFPTAVHKQRDGGTGIPLIQVLHDALYCLEILLCNWQDSVLLAGTMAKSGASLSLGVEGVEASLTSQRAPLLLQLPQLVSGLVDCLSVVQQQQQQRQQQGSGTLLDAMQVIRFKCRVLLFQGAAAAAPALGPQAPPAARCLGHQQQRVEGQEEGEQEPASSSAVGGQVQQSAPVVRPLWGQPCLWVSSETLCQGVATDAAVQAATVRCAYHQGDTSLASICQDPLQAGVSGGAPDHHLAQQQQQQQPSQQPPQPQPHLSRRQMQKLLWQQAHQPPQQQQQQQIQETSTSGAAGVVGPITAADAPAITSSPSPPPVASWVHLPGSCLPPAAIGDSAQTSPSLPHAAPTAASTLPVLPAWALPAAPICSAARDFISGSSASAAVNRSNPGGGLASACNNRNSNSLALAWGQRLAGMIAALLTPGMPHWWPSLTHPAVQSCLGANPYCPLSCTLAALEVAARFLPSAPASTGDNNSPAADSANSHTAASGGMESQAPTSAVNAMAAGVACGEKQGLPLAVPRRPLLLLLLHMAAAAAAQVRQARQQEVLLDTLWHNDAHLSRLVRYCSQDTVLVASASRLAVICTNRLVARLELERTGGVILSADAARDLAAAEAAALLPAALLAPATLLRRLVRDAVRHSGQQPLMLELLRTFSVVARSAVVGALMLDAATLHAHDAEQALQALVRSARGGAGPHMLPSALCVALRELLLPQQATAPAAPAQGAGTCSSAGNIAAAAAAIEASASTPTQDSVMAPAPAPAPAPLASAERAALLQLCAVLADCRLAEPGEQLVAGALPVLQARLDGAAGRTQVLAALMWTRQALGLPASPEPAVPQQQLHNDTAQPNTLAFGLFMADPATIASALASSACSATEGLVQTVGASGLVLLLGQLLDGYRSELSQQGVMDAAGMDLSVGLVGWVAWAVRAAALRRWETLRVLAQRREWRAKQRGLLASVLRTESQGPDEEGEEEEEEEDEQTQVSEGQAEQDHGCSVKLPRERNVSLSVVSAAGVHPSAVAEADEQQAEQLLRLLLGAAARKLQRPALIALLPALEAAVALAPLLASVRAEVMEGMLPSALWRRRPAAGRAPASRSRAAPGGGAEAQRLRQSQLQEAEAAEREVAAQRVAQVLEWCTAGDWHCALWLDALLGHDATAATAGATSATTGPAEAGARGSAAMPAVALDAMARGVTGAMHRALLPGGRSAVSDAARHRALASLPVALAALLPTTSAQGAARLLDVALPALVWACSNRAKDEDEDSEDDQGQEALEQGAAEGWVEAWARRSSQADGHWAGAAASTRHALATALQRPAASQPLSAQFVLQKRSDGVSRQLCSLAAPSTAAYCLHLSFRAVAQALQRDDRAPCANEQPDAGARPPPPHDTGLPAALHAAHPQGGVPQAVADRCFTHVGAHIQRLVAGSGSGSSSSNSAAESSAKPRGRGSRSVGAKAEAAGVSGVAEGLSMAGGAPAAPGGRVAAAVRDAEAEAMAEARRLALALVALEEGVACLEGLASAASGAAQPTYDCNTLQVLLLTLARTLCTPHLLPTPAALCLSDTMPAAPDSGQSAKPVLAASKQPSLACLPVPYVGLLALVSKALGSLQHSPVSRQQLMAAALQVTEDHLAAQDLADAELEEIAVQLFEG